MVTERHRIRVGPAGWSYDDWNGVVYPDGKSSRFDPLAYLAGFFDTIEVNSSFYRIPPPAHSKSWVRRVASNPDFAFTTKLYRGFTHEAAFPSDAETGAFRAYLDNFADAGKLGAVLAQFPWSFRNTESAYERIERIASLLAPAPVVVEVRHGGFDDPKFHRFLDGIGVGFANIDQPVIGDSIEPGAVVTGGAGYVRFHGRNYKKWFQHEESWERYDYLYTQEELDPWVERIEAIAEKGQVYVITNNHFRGQAIVNAIDLKRSLGQRAEVPEPLAGVYAERLRK